MKIQPLHDKVIVRPKPKADQTSGGLLLPANAQERQSEGTVVAVGPGRLHETTGQFKATAVKADQQVLYAKYSGAEFEHNGETLLMLDEGDILAILTPEE